LKHPDGAPILSTDPRRIAFPKQYLRLILHIYVSPAPGIPEIL
jgi:hypothetical protein